MPCGTLRPGRSRTSRHIGPSITGRSARRTPGLRRYVQHITLTEACDGTPAPAANDGVSVFWYDGMESVLDPPHVAQADRHRARDAHGYLRVVRAPDGPGSASNACDLRAPARRRRENRREAGTAGQIFLREGGIGVVDDGHVQLRDRCVQKRRADHARREHGPARAKDSAGPHQSKMREAEGRYRRVHAWPVTIEPNSSSQLDAKLAGDSLQRQRVHPGRLSRLGCGPPATLGPASTRKSQGLLGWTAMNLYDTLSGAVRGARAHRSLSITLYVCGITPYDTTHIGHAFTSLAYVLVPLHAPQGLRRHLRPERHRHRRRHPAQGEGGRARLEGAGRPRDGEVHPRHGRPQRPPPDHYPRATDHIPRS